MPKIWNSIPLLVVQSPSLDSFKCNLKTHYFANNWPPGDCIQRLWFDILGIVRSTNCYEWMNEWMDTGHSFVQLWFTTCITSNNCVSVIYSAHSTGCKILRSRTCLSRTADRADEWSADTSTANTEVAYTCAAALSDSRSASFRCCMRV